MIPVFGQQSRHSAFTRQGFARLRDDVSKLFRAQMSGTKYGGITEDDITVDGTWTFSAAPTFSAGATFNGNILLSGTNKLQLGDAGQYIHESAATVLSYVTAGRHEFTGGPVYVGSGSPNQATSADDLFVTDILEVDGRARFDGEIWAYTNIQFLTWARALSFVAGVCGAIYTGLDDGLRIAAGNYDGSGNNHIIFTCNSNVAKDHDHDTMSTNPTLFVHSVTNPDTNNTQWWSIAHDQTDAVYSRGTGVHKFDTNIRLGESIALQWIDADHFITYSGSQASLLLSDNVAIGSSVEGVDYTLTFKGSLVNGILTWMDDEDYFKFSDDIFMDGAEKLMFRQTTEYFSSDAAGYLDAHWADDDKGMRFYSGANLLMSVHRQSAAAPTRTRMVFQGQSYIYVGGTVLLTLATSRIIGQQDFGLYDNKKLILGDGDDATVYYDATNLIIDPDVVGTGKVLIGATGDDDLWCAGLKTSGGWIVNTTRITGNTTLNATHHNVFCDTDGGGFTVTLPALVDGTVYRIINTGSSGKTLTVAPNGSDLLLGVNSSLTMADGDVLVIVGETTEGWW
jgi:hypothetical protein